MFILNPDLLQNTYFKKVLQLTNHTRQICTQTHISSNVFIFSHKTSACGIAHVTFLLSTLYIRNVCMYPQNIHKIFVVLFTIRLSFWYLSKCLNIRLTKANSQMVRLGQLMIVHLDQCSHGLLHRAQLHQSHFTVLPETH